jgi:hypothetical protein
MYSKKFFSRKAAGFYFKKLHADVKAAKEPNDIDYVKRAGEYLLANTHREETEWALDEYGRLMKEVGEKVNEMRQTSSGFGVSGQAGPVGGSFGKENTTEPLL